MRAGTFKFLENWKIEEVDAHTGKVLNTEEVCNTITNAGLERMAKLLNNVSGTHFNSLAIGTGITGATATDVALETEYTRAVATLAYLASYKATFTKTFTFASGVSENITEAGIFDNVTASGSTMLARTTFSAKAITGDVSLIVTATITMARV